MPTTLEQLNTMFENLFDMQKNIAKDLSEISDNQTLWSRYIQLLIDICKAKHEVKDAIEKITK